MLKLFSAQAGGEQGVRGRGAAGGGVQTGAGEDGEHDGGLRSLHHHRQRQHGYVLI